jgi:hypothetical protein
MWVVLGRRVRTECLEGGRTRTLTCEACGGGRQHVERRVVHTATAFFAPVANVLEQTVFECTGCGRQLRNDQTRTRWFGTQEGTALGTLGERVVDAATALADPDAVEGARRAMGEAVGRLQDLGAGVVDDWTGASARAPAEPEEAQEVAEPDPERARRGFRKRTL